MTADLSFFDYKRAVITGYESQSTVTPFHDLGDTEFYRFSFYNRGSAELQYKLLNMLVKVEELPEHYRKQAEYYIEAGARFLKRDADIADNTAEAKNYAEKIDYFEKRRAPDEQAVDATMTDWQKSVDRFHKDLEYFVSAPLHVSKIITLLSYTNLYRLVTLFSRLSVKFFWTLASEQHWIDAQDKLFGYAVQRPALDIPAAGLNFISVALFAARLAAHGAMIYKHARSKRAGEKDIDAWDRAVHEFFARLINIMNDFAWVIINLLTNYAAVWGIADPLSNALVMVALAWDFSWLLIHWYRENNAWNEEKAKLVAWSQESTDSNDLGIIRFQMRMIADLKIETHAKYAFMVLACALIITSYSLFLLGISALVSTVALCVCVVGFAMYGSADEFAGVVRAYLGDLQIRGEREEMRAKFFNTFTKTMLPPFIVMGLLSLGWQVAVLGAIAAVANSYAPAKWDCRGIPPEEVNALPAMATVALANPNTQGYDGTSDLDLLEAIGLNDFAMHK